MNRNYYIHENLYLYILTSYCVEIFIKLESTIQSLLGDVCLSKRPKIKKGMKHIPCKSLRGLL